ISRTFSLWRRASAQLAMFCHRHVFKVCVLTALQGLHVGHDGPAVRYGNGMTVAVHVANAPGHRVEKVPHRLAAHVVRVQVGRLHPGGLLSLLHAALGHPVAVARVTVTGGAVDIEALLPAMEGSFVDRYLSGVVLSPLIAGDAAMIVVVFLLAAHGHRALDGR